MNLVKILRQLLVLCLLLTIPALGMAGHMPCDAGHHQQSQDGYTHHHDANATHGHDFGHDNHDSSHGQASHQKCCDGAGGCCMSMILSLGSPIGLAAPGSEMIALTASLFTAVIPETPQRPPSTFSA